MAQLLKTGYSAYDDHEDGDMVKLERLKFWAETTDGNGGERVFECGELEGWNQLTKSRCSEL